MCSYKLYFAMGVHPGMMRDANEDSVAFEYPQDYTVLRQRGAIFALADGVATVADGAAASAYAVQRLITLYYLEPRGKSLQQSLVDSIKQVNAEMLRNTNMGASTIVAAVFHQQEMIVAHTGDSRAYWRDARNIQALTQDHVREDLLPNGRTKRRVTRVLGHQTSLHVDVMQRSIRPQDKIVLLSDGVTRYVDDFVLRELTEGSPAESVRSIVYESNAQGGIDNISAIVIEVGEETANQDDLTAHQQHLQRESVLVDVSDSTPMRSGSPEFFERYRPAALGDTDPLGTQPLLNLPQSDEAESTEALYEGDVLSAFASPHEPTEPLPAVSNAESDALPPDDAADAAAHTDLLTRIITLLLVLVLVLMGVLLYLLLTDQMASLTGAPSAGASIAQGTVCVSGLPL